MLIVGLTGSIGMGKSETAKMFARLGVPVYDSDAAVHALYEQGGAAVVPVEAAFPGVLVDGRIDRGRLGTMVVNNRDAMRRLEAIVHPMVGASQRRFLEQAHMQGVDLVVLDIPLLFESGGEQRVDAVVVVSAPPYMQRERVLARPGMTLDRFESILMTQMTDEEKRKRADFVVDTSQGLEHAERQVAEIVTALKRRQGKVWKSNA